MKSKDPHYKFPKIEQEDFLTKINSPLQIGSLTLANRLIQAPLAGISCAPFRELFSLYLKPAYAVTEMISANSIIQHQNLHKRYLTRSENEGLWCIQISGNDSELMFQATEICASFKPDLIDLNCGCPMPKIRNRGSGSALMESPEKLQKVVSAMRRATSLPLTVKIRVAGNTNDNSYLEAAKIIEGSGADAIIVHGRHHSENYENAVNYQQIKRVVKELSIPVIANGDVFDKVSLRDCFENTSASAFMIARGSIGKPWLFQQLLGADINPTILESIEVFRYHISKLAILEESEGRALLQARRLLKWYFPHLDKANMQNCYKISNLEDLYARLRNI